MSSLAKRISSPEKLVIIAIFKVLTVVIDKKCNGVTIILKGHSYTAYPVVLPHVLPMDNSTERGGNPTLELFTMIEPKIIK